MKILLDKWVCILYGEHQGKIFQLRYYNTLLCAAYFPGPPPILISIDELELIDSPFPYWRSCGDGMMYRIQQPNSERCDTLPIGEQSSRCAARSLKVRTHIKLYKESFRKDNKKANNKNGVFSDRYYEYLIKERKDEALLSKFLRSVVPVPEMAREDLSAIASKFQHLAPTRRGGNIASPDVEEILETTQPQGNPIFPPCDLPEEKSEHPRERRGGNIASPDVEEILETTQPQGKPIFPPCDLPEKKGGRPRGRPNNNLSNGWLDIHYNQDGTARYYYCRHKVRWATKKTRVPDGKVESVKTMIETGYSIAQIEDSI